MRRSLRSLLASFGSKPSTFVLGLTMALLAGACGGQPEQEAPPPLQEPEYDGLSREQIEERATSMTPEEAERLGIVDTTIHIEPPVNPDSLLIEEVPSE